tara:strand:+ start:111 stop:308 length:198 start_codon:yes stop_codon:yes gene_type:complete
MSGEQITSQQNLNQSKSEKKFTSKVDINILLNKVRAEQKKEKYENLIFLGLISFVVIISGLIISL